MSARLQSKLSIPFSAQSSAEQGTFLSGAELGFFKEHGFLIKERLVGAERVARELERTWAHLQRHVPPHADSDWRLEPGDPTTWKDPEWSPMAPHPETGYYQGRQPREAFRRTVKLHDLGWDDSLTDLLPRHADVRAVARALLGDDLKPTECTRGVYALFPGRNKHEPSGAMLGPHTDQVCQQLNACLYLDDVKPRNGGFTVWPGSHRIMWKAHEFEANFSPNPRFRECMREVIETIEPYELTAPQGSVIFWHGRTMHSGGVHAGDDIRWALFADFSHNRPILDEDEHRSLGQYEWFKDTKLFREDHPTTDDMWRHWNCGS
ncbi:MAG: hypothetical protein CMQ29_15055 [Gammaproteobacteria bacterium]|nr:hypothetical protein [Gammaproteobacteria bacterium]|tara:strand:- start:16 stop:978 length:963 start_codon:yes stop_codon:yes gene_type:complete